MKFVSLIQKKRQALKIPGLDLATWKEAAKMNVFFNTTFTDPTHINVNQKVWALPIDKADIAFALEHENMAYLYDQGNSFVPLYENWSTTNKQRALYLNNDLVWGNEICVKRLPLHYENLFLQQPMMLPFFYRAFF